MSWAKFDDMFPWHRKVRRLSDAAFRLHTTSIMFASKDETDGVITLEDIDEMPSIKSRDKSIPDLVQRGLWEVVEGGWKVHDYLDYNPSAEHQARARAAAAERQRKSRERRIAKDSAEPASRRDSPVTDDVTDV